MRYSTFGGAAAVLLALSSLASATTFTFNTDPFAGTDVLNTPGRQIVTGENFISFSPATDVFWLDSSVFGVGSDLGFFNGSASVIPPDGENVIVLETFDNDNNPQTPFGAANAADLIASRVTTAGPGFFIYFNQALNLPRLVFSTDLSSNTADLKILARMLNLTGADGQNALPTFSAANFEITATAAAPEPGSIFLMLASLGVCCCIRWPRKSCTVIRRATAVTLALAAVTLTPAFSQTESQSHGKYEIEFTKVVDTTKEFSSFGSFPAMNNHGDIAFTAVSYGNAGVFRVRQEGEKVTAIASVSTKDLLTFFDQVAVNADGVVAFGAGTVANTIAIFKGDGTSRTLIADSTVNGLFKLGVGAPSINAAGIVAFSSVLSQRGFPGAIFKGSGGPLTTVASTSPGGFLSFGNVAVNDFGTVVFPANSADGSSGVFTIASKLTDIVDTNAHPEFDSFGDPVINNAGTVADYAFVPALSAPQIFTGTAHGITPRNDPSNPHFANSEHPSLNNHGAVAFFALPPLTGSGPTGIFLEVSGGQSLIPVIKPGDKLFGSTVGQVDLGRFALNDRFQMVFSYTLTDGRSGIAIAAFAGESEGDN